MVRKILNYLTSCYLEMSVILEALNLLLNDFWCHWYGP